MNLESLRTRHRRMGVASNHTPASLANASTPMVLPLLEIPGTAQSAETGFRPDGWNDVAQFADLWPAAAEQVAVFLRAAVFSRDDREDLEQAVAQKSLAAFAAFCPEQGSFTAWVLGIARNEYLHYLRSRRRARVLFDSHLADQAVAELCRSEQPAAAEWEDALRRELAVLGPEQRELLRLKYEENLSCGEIAARLGAQEAAIRQRLHRLRTGLKERLRTGPPAA